MRVLVTGHRGYIGSVVTGVLRHARFEVAGLDCDLYRGCDFGRMRDPVPGFDIDLRDIEFADLLSFDAVVHLAALPEGSPQEPDARLAYETNVEATLRLAECCKQARVSRFLFASSCMVYGHGNGKQLDERSPTRPSTVYAASKLQCEQELARLADNTFTPVILRNPSVYGVSPRLRLDLVVNDFVVAAVTSGRIEMNTAGHDWRSLIHVEDLARAYAAIIAAPDEVVRNEVFNVAVDDEDYRVIDIADIVTEHVPDCTRVATSRARDDCSYRVDSAKLRRACPSLSFRWTLPLGVRQLRNATAGAGLTPGDWRSDRYRRAPRLKTSIERGELDADLRRLIYLPV